MIKENPSSSRARVAATARSVSPTVKKSSLSSPTPRNASSAANRLREDMDEGNLPLQSSISRSAAPAVPTSNPDTAREGRSSAAGGMDIAQKSRLKSQGKAMKESTSPPGNGVEERAGTKIGVASAVISRLNQVAEERINVYEDREKPPRRINRRERLAGAGGIRAKRRGCYVADLQARRRPVSVSYNTSCNREGGVVLLQQALKYNPARRKGPDQTSSSSNSLLMDLEDYLKHRASSVPRSRGHHVPAVVVTEDVEEPRFLMRNRKSTFYASECLNNKQMRGGAHLLRTHSAEAQDIVDIHAAAAQSDFERSTSGCGGISLLQHFPSTTTSCVIDYKNDQSLLHYAGGCFSGSGRRRMRKLKRFNCARSVSSPTCSQSSDAEEMAPLMATEPELVSPHEFSGETRSSADNSEAAASSSSVVESEGDDVEDAATHDRLFQQQQNHRGADLPGKLFSCRSRVLDVDRSETGSNKLDHMLPQKQKQREFEAMGGGNSKHRSLSAKYRPRTFRDLMGQDMVAETLSNAICRGKIAPLYLFHGPRGTGKTSAAKIFTCAMNCLSIEELRPCGLCKACVSFNAGGNYDVKEVDAAGNCSLDSIRLVLKHLCLRPISSRYKVFIMDDCHMLTPDAWNALLKSLDDPPDHAVFILITTHLERLPRSTISRCQKFMFSRIKDADIVCRLRELADKESIDIEADALHFIAGQSDGSFRDAETMLDQLSLLGKRVTTRTVREMMGLIPDEELLNLLESAMSSDAVNTVDAIRGLMAAGYEPLAVVSQLAARITDVLAGRCKISTIAGVGRDLQEKLQKALRILSDLEKQLRSCNDRATWLTAAFVQLASTSYNSGGEPTCSGGSTTAQSPASAMAICRRRRDTNSDSNGELELEEEEEPAAGDLSMSSASRRHSWGGSGKERDVRIPCQLLEYDSGAGAFADKKVYSQSPHTADTYEVLADGAILTPCLQNGDRSSSSFCSGKATIMSPSTMENIWRKVLQSCQSLNLRQLLQVEGRLISLSVTEEFAIAKLEFRSSEHKAMAERATDGISRAFQSALFCPVKMEISLCQRTANSSMEANLNGAANQLEQGGNSVERMPTWSRSSKSFQKLAIGGRSIIMPSPTPPPCHGLECSNPAAAAAGYETDSKLYSHNKSSNKCVGDFGTCKHMQLDPKTDGLMAPKSVDDSELMMKSEEKRSNYWNESKGEDMDACYSSDSEIGEKYVLGGLLCWKATRSKDDKVHPPHHHVLSRRRTRFLVRLVPCAKEEESEDEEGN